MSFRVHSSSSLPSRGCEYPSMSSFRVRVQWVRRTRTRSRVRVYRPRRTRTRQLKEEAKGGARRWCRDTAFTWCAWESPRSQCGQGELVFLALAGRAVRRLGDSAPRWPAGSPAQWQRPRMWICVGPRDPDTKPSRGRLWVGVRKPRLVLSEYRATRNKVTATPRSYVRGCARSR